MPVSAAAACLPDGVDVHSERWMGRAIAASAVFALVVVLGLAGILIQRGHEQAIERAQTDVQQVARRTEADLNRHFVALDAFLADVASWMLKTHFTTATSFAEEATTRRLLQAALHQNMMLRDVLVVDALHRVLVSALTQQTTTVGADRSSADWLQTVLQQPYPALVLGSAGIDPLSGEQVLHIGRSARLSNGQTIAVVAVLRVALLSAQMNPRDLGEELCVTLENTAGAVLATHPHNAHLDVNSVLHPSLAELVAQQERPVWNMPDRLKPEQASWLAVRPLLYPDVWVSVGMSHQAALSNWQHDARAIAGVTVVLALLIGGLWWGGVRHLQRMARARIDLLDSHEALGHANAMLKATLEATADAILVVNNAGVVTQLNAQYQRLFPGHTARVVVGAHINEVRRLLRPLLDNADEVSSVALRAYDEPNSETLDELRFTDGRVFLRHSLPQVLNDEPVGRVWSYQDITAFRQIEKRLREREQALKQTRDELQATLEALPDFLFEVDEDGRYLDVHMHPQEQQQFPPAFFLGRRVAELLPPSVTDKVMACLRQAKTNGRAYGTQIKLRLTGTNGVRWFELSAACKPTPPHELARFVVIARDITVRKQQEAQIWEQAHFDALTGLPNRRMFREQLLKQLKPYVDRLAHDHAAAAAMPKLAVLFVDLDRFKEVNDTHGHEIGDLLLKQVAQRIRSAVREHDVVARLGGDEFTVVLKGLDTADSATVLAERLLLRLSEPFDLDGEVEHISGSIGVTLCPDDGTDSETLVRHADQAMYAAKHAGRNRWERFTPPMEEAATMRARTARDLRTALVFGQLQVVYQPIVSLSTGRVLKAEALLRWQHPQHGYISPALFIRVAEETGLIAQIGRWVFEQATQQVQQWRKRLDPAFQISINQSAMQFRHTKTDGNEAAYWLNRLQQLDLPGCSVILEITESVLIDGSATTRAQLRQLREAGVGLALDDFGTGYSALSYLHQYDLDWLKIDQAFVRHVPHSHKDLALCKATIAMAHALGLQVIAEGIETEAQRGVLHELGCDAGQGFWFAKGMAPEAFEAWFEAHHTSHPR